MTELSGIALRDLLPESFEGMADLVRKESSRNPAPGQASVPDFAWKLIGAKAGDALRESLDGDLFTSFAKGWCLCRELHEYSDPAKHPPGETSLVFLGEHNATQTVPLVLDLALGPIPLLSLPFSLDLTAAFESAGLVIQDGRITGLAAGKCHVRAQLRYGNVNLHKAKETRKLNLPAQLDFRPGWRIG